MKSEMTEEEIFEHLEALVKMGLARKYLENGEWKYQAIGPSPEELKSLIVEQELQ